jgi:phosphopantetheine adenylyltransferase
MIATTGFFDGVHLGHQALLQRVVHLAHETGQESAVITFRPHPRQVLFHQHIPLLTSLEEKKKLITQQGIDQIFMIPFSPEFASLTAEEFFQTYLKQQYRISTLVVGKDHTLGSDKANLAQLQIIGAAFGIKVQSIDDVVENGHRISSTQLRKKALREKMLNARLALPSSQRATRTERITQTVVSLPLFQQASHLYTYLDYRNEVGTKAIIQHARTQGKKVAVPKVVGQEIQFYYLQSFEELIPGYQGILEPTS